MKLFSSALAVAVLAAAMATGCTEAPNMRSSRLDPSIHLSPPTSIEAGTSTRVSAKTENLVGARNIRWTVSPSTGRLQAEEQTNGQSAVFSANEPGTYVISATADMGNGKMITADTNITVKGRPITNPTASERLNERPAPSQRP
jgi:hypothetical protein